MSSDPYQTLGISPNATLAEARAAYLKHVRVLHPDRFDPIAQKVEWELANQMLLELNAAWEAIEKDHATASDQEANPPTPGQPLPVPRPQPSSTKPTAPFSPPTSGPSFYSGKPITFSRAIGEVGPYSDQAMASLGFIFLGVLFFFSGLAFLFFIPGIILGHTAKFSIRKHDYRGLWMAVFALWAGYLGLISLGVLQLWPAPPPAAPPAVTVTDNQVEQLNNELAKLDNEQQQEIASAENNLDNSLSLLKLQAAALQAKIAEETKTLADLKQGPGTAAQIAGIESELQSNQSSLDEQMTFLAKPRDQQAVQIESQITSQFDERRRTIKDKLAQLEAGKQGNP